MPTIDNLLIIIARFAFACFILTNKPPHQAIDNPLCNYAIKSYSTFVTVAKEKAQINTSLLGLAKVAQILNVGLCCTINASHRK